LQTTVSALQTTVSAQAAQISSLQGTVTNHTAQITPIASAVAGLQIVQGDVSSVADIQNLVDHGLDSLIVKKLGLGLKAGLPELDNWRHILHVLRNPKHEISIAVVGKYAEHKDAYKSIYEALDHAGIHHECQVRVGRIQAEEIEREGAGPLLTGYDGLLVPGGFGERGIEGKIEAIKFARERGIPFFGICLGMQCAAIEFARHVAGLNGAHSTEFNKDTAHPVICLLDEQKNITDKGGTMRLGAQPAALAEGSKACEAYGRDRISERHRHRYEFNNVYRQQFAAHGFAFTGTSPDGKLVEIIELPEHPWFLAVQFHPEFKSKPTAAQPLFAAFVGAAIQRHNQRGERLAESSGTGFQPAME
jgi:CTP synthase